MPKTSRDLWKEGKYQFARITRVKWPAPEGVLDEDFDDTELKKVLKAVDFAQEKAEKDGANLKNFESVAVKYRRKAAKYAKRLQKEAKQKRAAGEKALYRGLKALKTKLDAIDTTIQRRVDHIKLASQGGDGDARARTLPIKPLGRA